MANVFESRAMRQDLRSAGPDSGARSEKPTDRYPRVSTIDFVQKLDDLGERYRDLYCPPWAPKK